VCVFKGGLACAVYTMDPRWPVAAQIFLAPIFFKMEPSWRATVPWRRIELRPTSKAAAIANCLAKARPISRKGAPELSQLQLPLCETQPEVVDGDSDSQPSQPPELLALCDEPDPSRIYDAACASSLADVKVTNSGAADSVSSLADVADSTADSVLADITDRKDSVLGVVLDAADTSVSSLADVQLADSAADSVSNMIDVKVDSAASSVSSVPDATGRRKRVVFGQIDVTDKSVSSLAADTDMCANTSYLSLKRRFDRMLG
jgi:hypothetical protein